MLDVTDDEFMRLLDKKIAELDKQIQKEESKGNNHSPKMNVPKEAEKKTEASDRGRSAEIIRMPLGDWW